MKRLKIALASFCLGLFIGPDGPVTVRWKWKEGEPYIYRLSEETRVHYKEQSADFPADYQSNLSWCFDWKLTPVQMNPDGSAEIEVRYEEVKVSFKSPSEQREGEYDSTRGETEPAQSYFKPFAALKGRSFRVALDPLGRATGFTGLDTIEKEIDKDVGGWGYCTAEMWRGTFPDIVKHQWHALFHGLPEKPIKKDDSWKTIIPIQHYLFALQSESTHKVKSIETVKDSTVVKFQSKEKWKVLKQPSYEDVEKLEIEKSEGDSSFSVDAGRWLQSRYSVQLEIQDALGAQTISESGKAKWKKQKVLYQIEHSGKLEFLRKQTKG